MKRKFKTNHQSFVFALLIKIRYFSFKTIESLLLLSMNTFISTKKVLNYKNNFDFYHQSNHQLDTLASFSRIPQIYVTMDGYFQIKFHDDSCFLKFIYQYFIDSNMRLYEDTQ